MKRQGPYLRTSKEKFSTSGTMPARLAESTSGLVPLPSEAILGTIINSNDVQTPAHPHALQNALSTFASLPSEIHVGIMKHFNPVSQMCLGLTCRELHNCFHEIHGAEGKGWNVKRRPFDLRMQSSICGQYMLNWWYDDWFLRDSVDIIWDRSLGELLFDEKWLWGDLICCEGCLKYKPGTAFDTFAWETETLRQCREEVALIKEGEIEWYMDYCCRRCRAKKMLLTLKNRHEVLEDGEDWDDRKSLGLRKTTIGSNTADRSILQKFLTGEEWHAAYYHYESWQEIFAKLRI